MTLANRCGALVCFLCVVLVCVVLAGCHLGDARSPESPVFPSLVAASRSQTADFYPLSVGNLWRYDREFIAQPVSPDGEPGDPVVSRSQVEIRQVGWEEIGGRDYMREETVDLGTPGPTLATYYRQDRDGLYTLDPPGASRWASFARLDAAWYGAAGSETRTDSEGSRARSVLRHRYIIAALMGRVGSSDAPVTNSEALQLSYPIHPGGQWTIRESPLFTARVEGADRLRVKERLYNAWRVRIDSELFGENDAVYIWYNRCGMLQLAVHTVSALVDELGEPIGTAVLDETYTLTEVELSERRGCAP